MKYRVTFWEEQINQVVMEVEADSEVEAIDQAGMNEGERISVVSEVKNRDDFEVIR